MSNELAVVQNGPTALAPAGGPGVDFSSHLMRIRTNTLSINQPTTQAEGAIKGKLRIHETGEQFDSLFVSLLALPKEKRKYYGEKSADGMISKSAENLLCFCDDVKRRDKWTETSGPDARSRVPQAFKCQGCPKGSWEKYIATKKKGVIDKSLMPPCDDFFHIYLIAKEFPMPLQFFARSEAKSTFEDKIFSVLTSKLWMLNRQGKNPQWIDVGFRLSTTRKQNGNTVTYSPLGSEFRETTEEERDVFREIFDSFNVQLTPQPVVDQVANANDAIDAEVLESTGADDTITI